MRGEDHGAAVRDLVQRPDEHRSLPGQVRERVRVARQLPADVHGAAAGHRAAGRGQRLRRAVAPRARARPAACGSRTRPTTRPPPTGPPPRRAGPPGWPRRPRRPCVPSRCWQVATKIAAPPSSAPGSAQRPDRREGDTPALAPQRPADQRRGRARQRAAHRVPDLGRDQHLTRGHAGCRAPANSRTVDRFIASPSPAREPAAVPPPIPVTTAPRCRRKAHSPVSIPVRSRAVSRPRPGARQNVD